MHQNVDNKLARLQQHSLAVFYVDCLVQHKLEDSVPPGIVEVGFFQHVFLHVAPIFQLYKINRSHFK